MRTLTHNPGTVAGLAEGSWDTQLEQKLLEETSGLQETCLLVDRCFFQEAPPINTITGQRNSGQRERHLATQGLHFGTSPQVLCWRDSLSILSPSEAPAQDILAIVVLNRAPAQKVFVVLVPRRASDQERLCQIRKCRRSGICRKRKEGDGGGMRTKQNQGGERIDSAFSSQTSGTRRVATHKAPEGHMQMETLSHEMQFAELMQRRTAFMQRRETIHREVLKRTEG